MIDKNTYSCQYFFHNSYSHFTFFARARIPLSRIWRPLRRVQLAMPFLLRLFNKRHMCRCHLDVTPTTWLIGCIINEFSRVFDEMLAKKKKCLHKIFGNFSVKLKRVNVTRNSIWMYVGNTVSYLHGSTCFLIRRCMLFVYTNFVLHMSRRVRPLVASDYGWQNGISNNKKCI